MVSLPKFAGNPFRLPEYGSCWSNFGSLLSKSRAASTRISNSKLHPHHQNTVSDHISQPTHPITRKLQINRPDPLTPKNDLANPQPDVPAHNKTPPLTSHTSSSPPTSHKPYKPSTFTCISAVMARTCCLASISHSPSLHVGPTIT